MLVKPRSVNIKGTKEEAVRLSVIMVLDLLKKPACRQQLD